MVIKFMNVAMWKFYLLLLLVQILQDRSRHNHATAQEADVEDANRESDIRQKIETEVLQRGATFEAMDPNDPRHLALDWMLHHDDLRLKSEDEALKQRYILALLAFALDSLAWYNCGDHRNVSNTTEYYAREDCWFESAATGQLETYKVWLSSTDECDWYGVICDSTDVVRGVELMVNDLVGEIPPEISQLKYLQYLALNGNCLYGSLPPELGEMPSLLSLELHGNGFSGTIPTEWFPNPSNASKLQLVNVAMQFQYSYSCQMSNGTTVNTLYKGGGIYSSDYNPGLWGGVLGSEVSRWSDLKGLHIFDNSFTGTIAEDIGYLNNLVFLRAHNNIINGFLPYNLFDLKKLREIYLFQNSIYSDLPLNLGNAEDLEDLRLHETEMFGPLPEPLYNLKKLTKLWLHDTIHCEEVEGSQQLEGWECAMSSDHGFSGTISTKIGNLGRLSNLFLNNNPLEGTLPTEIGLCEDLAKLFIHRTNIEGSAPLEVCALRDKELNSEDNSEGVFYSDCGPNNITGDPFFNCDCCTDCCDHTTEVCLALGLSMFPSEMKYSAAPSEINIFDTEPPTFAPFDLTTIGSTASPAPSANRLYCGVSAKDAKDRCDTTIPCPDGRNDTCLFGQACFSIQGACDTKFNGNNNLFPTIPYPPPTRSPSHHPTALSSTSPSGYPSKVHVYVPNSTNFCGVDYYDALGNCTKKQLCPLSLDEECPAGETCFPGILNCETSAPTMTPTIPVPTASREPSVSPTASPTKKTISEIPSSEPTSWDWDVINADSMTSGGALRKHGLILKLLHVRGLMGSTMMVSFFMSSVLL